MSAILHTLFRLLPVTCLVLAVAASAAERARVKVGKGTVLSEKGTPLRACHLWLGITDSRTKTTLTEATWMGLSKNNLNAVRLLISRSWGTQIPDDKVIPMIDQCVNYAAKAGVYVIIDFHDIMGRGGHKWPSMKAFWSKVAPRYKDRTHVFYEFLNEPGGGNGIGENGEHLQLWGYKLLRGHAPKTHLVMWSRLKPMKKFIADEVKGIDYSNASVGWHAYGWPTDGDLKDLMGAYPTFVTEFTDNKRYIPACEAKGLSWVGWGYGPTADDWPKVTWPADGNITTKVAGDGRSFTPQEWVGPMLSILPGQPGRLRLDGRRMQSLNP